MLSISCNPCIVHGAFPSPLTDSVFVPESTIKVKTSTSWLQLCYKYSNYLYALNLNVLCSSHVQFAFRLTTLLTYAFAL